MKVEVIPFKAEYLKQMTLSESGRHTLSLLSDKQALAVEKTPLNYTIIIDDRPVACGGVVTYWPGRGEVWAFLDQICKSEFLVIHRTVARFLEVCPHKRIEATVEKDFEPGHRWVKMLGFEVEAPLLKSYYPQGSDGVLYSRVKE